MHDDLVLGGKIEIPSPRIEQMHCGVGRLCPFGLDKASCKRTMNYVFQRIVQ